MVDKRDRRDRSLSIDVDRLDQGDMITGYIVCAKVLTEEGKCYWAMRNKDVNDMEALGMAHDMADTFQRQISNSDVHPGDE